MSENTSGLFPTHADEEQMVFGVTMSQFIIIFGTLFLILLTRMFLICTVVGVVLWFFYKKYKEVGQKNIIMQLAYKSGIYVPKSHIFSEPGVDSFRN